MSRRVRAWVRARARARVRVSVRACVRACVRVRACVWARKTAYGSAQCSSEPIEAFVGLAYKECDQDWPVRDERQRPPR
eukprot:6188075-Pleurochrysis_carterae.AAC.2